MVARVMFHTAAALFLGKGPFVVTGQRVARPYRVCVTHMRTVQATACDNSGPRQVLLVVTLIGHWVSGMCDTASFGERCFRWTKKNYYQSTGPQSTRAMHSFKILAATNMMTQHTPNSGILNYAAVKPRKTCTLR
jgi:hypothetical protein